MENADNPVFARYVYEMTIRMSANHVHDASEHDKGVNTLKQRAFQYDNKSPLSSATVLCESVETIRLYEFNV